MNETNKKIVRNVKIKLFLFVFLIISLIVVNHFMSQRSEKQHEVATVMIKTISNKLNLIFGSLQKIPTDIAFGLGNTTYGVEDLDSLLKSVVRSNDEIFGSAVAFEPYSFDSSEYFYAPYYFADGNKIHKINLGTDMYNYLIWDWYLLPKLLKHPVWSDPYFDWGGIDLEVSTFSVPIYHYTNDDSVFMGAITTDISLDWIDEINDEITKDYDGYVLLISTNGVIVSAPPKHENWELNYTIFSLALESKSDELFELGLRIRDEEFGEMYFDAPFDSCTFFKFRKIETNEWTLLTCIP